MALNKNKNSLKTNGRLNLFYYLNKILQFYKIIKIKAISLAASVEPFI